MISFLLSARAGFIDEICFHDTHVPLTSSRGLRRQATELAEKLQPCKYLQTRIGFTTVQKQKNRSLLEIAIHLLGGIAP